MRNDVCVGAKLDYADVEIDCMAAMLLIIGKTIFCKRGEKGFTYDESLCRAAKNVANRVEKLAMAAEAFGRGSVGLGGCGGRVVVGIFLG